MNRTLAFSLAFALGVGLGLLYSWVVNPVEYIDTAPASLRADFQADFLALIASAFASTGDLERARQRLALIPEVDPAARLAALAQQRLAAGFPASEAQAIASLASAIGGRPPPGATATPPPGGPTASPAATGTRTATAPPLPSRTPTATPGAPFRLLEREVVCDPDLVTPLVIVEVVDAAGNPVPGVEVLVVWDDGQDHFFTGLKPELGLGYGDFEMTPGVSYTVKLAESVQSVTGLASEECTPSSGAEYAGSWRLVFSQPGQTPPSP